MKESKDFILYDSLKNRKVIGEFTGSIISKCQDKIIFSDNLNIFDSEEISILQGLLVGFKDDENNKIAFSKTSDFNWTDLKLSPLEYSILIPENTMERYDKEQFSDDFPYTINLLHTAGLYLNDLEFQINHLDFFKDEILKNPVALIRNGIIVADRVVIDQNGDPVFYDCLIIGRDTNDELNVSYESFINVVYEIVKYIIILGVEELKK